MSTIVCSSPHATVSMLISNAAATGATNCWGSNRFCNSALLTSSIVFVFEDVGGSPSWPKWFLPHRYKSVYFFSSFFFLVVCYFFNSVSNSSSFLFGASNLLTPMKFGLSVIWFSSNNAVSYATALALAFEPRVSWCVKLNSCFDMSDKDICPPNPETVELFIL